MFILLIIYLFLFNFINGKIFYYDIKSDIFQKKNNIISNSNNSLFVFFPGTSSICDNYTQLFNTINPKLNTLCINYQSDYNNSVNYYKNHSFLDRSKYLEKYFTKALKNIYKTTNLNYLDNGLNLPNWNKIRGSGHSQGAIFPLVWAKKYNLERVIMFSGPGCQFGKNFHNWLKLPFITKSSNIYGVESLQDTILPWSIGNPFFLCNKKDSVHNYINSLGISNDKIQILTPSYYQIKKNKQILLINTPFISGEICHLLTSFNLNYLKKFREEIWLYTVT